MDGGVYMQDSQKTSFASLIINSLAEIVEKNICMRKTFTVS